MAEYLVLICTTLSTRTKSFTEVDCNLLSGGLKRFEYNISKTQAQNTFKVLVSLGTRSVLVIGVQEPNRFE